MRRFSFIDAHVDTITRAILPVNNVGLYENHLQLDFKRLSQFKAPVQVFALWLLDDLIADGLNRTNKMIDFFMAQVQAHEDLIEVALNLDDMERIASKEKISALLSLEGGEALMGELSNLDHFYNKGIRLIGLAWNRENELSHAPTSVDGPGLKPFGIDVVRRMNELGMIVDVSHLNEAGFWDVANNSKRPFIASHSNAYEVIAHRRNLKDDQIFAIVESDGLIGVVFEPTFLRSDDAHPSIDDLLEHIRHFIKIGAGDHIGLGSDFDGFIDGIVEGGAKIPTGLEDVSSMSFLEKRLTEEFGQEQALKIMYKNFHDFFKRYYS